MQTLQCSSCGKSFPLGTVLCPDDNTPLLSNTAPSSPNQTEPLPQAAGSPSKPASFEFGPGTQVGEYIVEKKIGQGGMGEVWRARHPKIGKRAAIKLLSQRLLNSTKAVTRFTNEALAVNEIQHRHIVDIFSFGELPDGKPYFIMEFLSGKSLADYLREKGPLPFSEILEILGPICKALQAAHDRGIIHRDLKPDNIFLILEEGERPFPKVLDFGIAKLSGEQGPDGKSLTGTGAVMGTASYMSPEQCEGAKAVDQRSDLYSLGVVLFEMITGRTPFTEPGDGVGLVISKHIHFAAPPVSSMVEGRLVPPSVDAFLQRALSKKAEGRPTSSLGFYAELQAAISDKRDEASASVKGAKPIYSSILQELPSEAQQAPARHNSTGDFYTGSSGDLEKPKRKSPALLGLALLVPLSLGLGYYFLRAPVIPEALVIAAPKLPASEPPKTPESAPASLRAVPASSAMSAPVVPLRTKTLILVVTPGGAKVSLGDESKEASNTAVFVRPYGEEPLSYTIEKEGYETQTGTFVPATDRQQEITLKPAKKSGSKGPNTEKPHTEKMGEGWVP